MVRETEQKGLGKELEKRGREGGEDRGDNGTRILSEELSKG